MHRLIKTYKIAKNEKELETLIQAMRICSQEIEVESVIEKCAMLIMRNEKTVEREGDDYTNRDWCFWYCHRRIIEETGGLGG